MKKDALPNSQQKRKLLYEKKVSPERLIATGELFLRAGRLNEAAELFGRADHRDGMEQLRALAIEQGDSFLYRVASRGSADGGRAEAWEALGKKAMELKKYTHAVRAFREAGNGDLMKAAEEALKEVVKEVVSFDKA